MNALGMPVRAGRWSVLGVVAALVVALSGPATAPGDVCCGRFSTTCYVTPPAVPCNFGDDTVVSASTCSPNPCGGACCLLGTCILTQPGTCVGQFLGTGTTCSPVPCPGACCTTAGACSVVLLSQCTAPSQFQGAGTACSPNPCPQPGACCTPTGACTVTLQASCTGAWLAAACTPNPCPIACCRARLGCSLLSAGDCNAAGGVVLASTCTPDPCVGSCCNPATGGCAVVLQAVCGALGLSDRGYGTLCVPFSCIALGACCNGPVCQMGSAISCFGSRFLGPGTSCTPAAAGAGVNPCCPADFTNSGVLDLLDIFAFLEAWFAGCP